EDDVGKEKPDRRVERRAPLHLETGVGQRLPTQQHTVGRRGDFRDENVRIGAGEGESQLPAQQLRRGTRWTRTTVPKFERPGPKSALAGALSEGFFGQEVDAVRWGGVRAGKGEVSKGRHGEFDGRGGQVSVFGKSQAERFEARRGDGIKPRGVGVGVS